MTDQSLSSSFGLRDPIGLCAACRHVRIVQSAHGSTFYLCRLAETDARFARYPRLPVMKCAGYESSVDDEGEKPSHPKPGFISSHQKPGTVT